MKVAIDISPLKSGHAGRGIGTYTDLLIKSLQKYETSNSYNLFTRGQIVPKEVDLIHIPYFDPFLLTLPFIRNKPIVVTVHDLIPIHYLKEFPRGIRGEFKWQIQKLLLKQSDQIITDSKASRKDIVNIIGIDPELISSIYLAPSDEYFQVTDIKEQNFVRKKYKLPESYILYVGDVNWNKNIPGIIKAFKKIKAELIKSNLTKYKLVLVGSAFLKSDLRETNDINVLIQKLGIENEIIKTGYVSVNDLRTIYSLAKVLVQPSFAEGFGLVPLEAMSSGCPTVVSDNSSLKEIAGPSRLCNPENSQDIADKVLEIINLSQDERNKLVLSGLAWVKSFNWQKIAHETTLVYEKVIAR
jgi:glycosyltransferase involved in cell wall biosynthesis